MCEVKSNKIRYSFMNYNCLLRRIVCRRYVVSINA